MSLQQNGDRIDSPPLLTDVITLPCEAQHVCLVFKLHWLRLQE